MRRPAIFRIPAFLLHGLGGALVRELLLGGQRVIPDKALGSGFVFRHETIRSAFDAMLAGNAMLNIPQSAPAAAQSAPPKQSVEQPTVETAAAAGLLGSLRLRTR